MNADPHVWHVGHVEDIDGLPLAVGVDYIDVAQRIADFRDKYPEGTLQPLSSDGQHGFRIVQADGYDKDGKQMMQTFVVVVAAAYRHPGDPRPGIGMAWEIFPGRTPYTRGSELQNAETSAWGRAIIAVGASDSKRGIASREEVRNRQAERDTWNGPEPASQDCRDGLHNSGCSNCRCHCHNGYPVNKDGSLSRSRMTDEQKAAAGVMTDAELKAHNKLEREVKGTGPQGVERGPLAPVDDRWTTDAPSWLVGVDPPEDQPGSILEAQRKQIMAVYSALGKRSHDDRMKDIENVLGVALDSTNLLSHQQAARLLENLHERHTGKMTRR